MNKHRLTKEQRIRDYEYMWDVLKKCFPVRGPMERVGYNWDEIEAECRPAVENAEDDLAFCRAMNRVFEKFEHFAHSNLFNAAMFNSYKKMMAEFYEGKHNVPNPEMMKPWAEIFQDPRSEKFYSAFDSSKGAGRDFYWKGEAPEPKPGAALKRGEGPMAVSALLPGNIAYFRIPTLAAEQVDLDRPVFMDFYKEHKSCEHMIVDFRGNGGGNTEYWKQLIVEPIITEPLTVENYMLYCDNELNHEFIKHGFLDESEFDGKNFPISELPDFPNFHKEYLGQPTGFFKSEERYKPDPDHRFEVRGKVWMLTDKRVYSASEGFAIFCKSTGFATLVGERTGGDGVGIAPFHAMLPESGMIIRYSGEMGLNPDGGSNAEYRTEPDVKCEPEMALVVCLSEIEKETERT